MLRSSSQLRSSCKAVQESRGAKSSTSVHLERSNLWKVVQEAKGGSQGQCVYSGTSSARVGKRLKLSIRCIHKLLCTNNMHPPHSPLHTCCSWFLVHVLNSGSSSRYRALLPPPFSHHLFQGCRFKRRGFSCILTPQISGGCTSPSFAESYISEEPVIQGYKTCKLGEC